MSSLNICLLCLNNSDGIFEIFGKRGIELNAAAILKVHFWFEVSETDEKSVCEKCWWTVHHFDVFYNSVKLNHQNQSIFDVKSVVIDSTEHNELPALLDAIKDESLNHQHQSIFDVKSVVINFTEHNELPTLLDAIKDEPSIDIENDLDECSTDISNIPYSFDVRESYDGSEQHHATNHANHTTDSPTITRIKRQTKRTTSLSRIPKKFKTGRHHVTDHTGNHTTDPLTTAVTRRKRQTTSVSTSPKKTERHAIDHATDSPTITRIKRQTKRTTSLSRSPKKFKTGRHHVTDHTGNHTTDPLTTAVTRRKRQTTSVSTSPKKTERHAIDHAANHTANHTTDSLTMKRRKRQTERTTSVYASPHKFKTDSHTLLLSTYFKMACDLCDTLLSSYRDTKKHYKDVHNIRKGYLTCCRKKFVRLQHMLQHCQWHMNPDSFKCSFCQKCFTDKMSLHDHSRKVHSPEAEREFQCEICKKSFAKSHLLRSHMKVNHVKNEDRQFECDICKRRFVILLLLKNHINMVHRNVHSHICEVCAKPFKSENGYKMHYVTFHTNISQKVQCDKCGKWLKHKESLKKHFLLHNGKAETCKICGRVCSNFRALRNHIRNTHSEASLECTICGKMFKKQQVLKEHMAIHAGNTDLYTCTFCTRTFRSSANMYSHRKRAHPIELEQKKASMNCLAPATAV